MKVSFASLEFLGALLRPIVSFALRKGVGVGQFEEVLRNVYVSEAAKEFEKNGLEINVSRLSVATGLNRRDVTRIWNGEGRIEPPAGLLTKVIGQWRGDPRFSDKGDRPKPLGYRGDDSEFAGLVRSVSRDLNPYTVMFELERIGIATKEEEKIILKGEVMIAPNDLKRGCELLGADFHDLLSAVDHNLASSDEFSPHHHIRTQYDNIVVDELPRIRAWLLKKGAELHEEVRNFLSRLDKDLNPQLAKKQGGARVALGSFSFVDDPDGGGGFPHFEKTRKGRNNK